MAQMEQQLVLNMEIIDSCVSAQHLVGVGEIEIRFIEVGPPEGLIVTRF
jgi:hypothetical protein